MWRWLVLGVPHVFWLLAFIYLYNTQGRAYLQYDTLSVALTSLEVTLVVFGLAGFGFLAVIAERTAERTARKTSEQEAKEEVRRLVPSMVRRAVREEWDAIRSAGSEGTDEDIRKLMGELDKNGGEHGDEK